MLGTTSCSVVHQVQILGSGFPLPPTPDLTPRSGVGSTASIDAQSSAVDRYPVVYIPARGSVRSRDILLDPMA